MGLSVLHTLFSFSPPCCLLTTFTGEMISLLQKVAYGLRFTFRLNRAMNAPDLKILLHNESQATKRSEAHPLVHGPVPGALPEFPTAALAG